MRKIDLTGKRFGHLTVIREVGKQGKEFLWECKCGCGKITNVAGNNLKAGYVVSCGCSSKKDFKKYRDKNFVEGTKLDIISDMNKKQINNTSGVRGVYYSKTRNKWIAQIKFKGQVHNLGGFIDKKDAIEARQKAEEKYFKPVLDKYKKQ